jgi:hypothetical protein
VEQNGAQKLEKILKMQILPALKQMGIRMEWSHPNKLFAVTCLFY